MANPFSTVFLPSVAGSAGAAGTGALAGMAEAPFAAYSLEEKRLLNELLKWQAMMAQRPQFHALSPGQIPGQVDPLRQTFTQTGQPAPYQPRPLAPETAEMEKERAGFYKAKTAQIESGGGEELGRTSRISELIDRKEARGIPLTPFEQSYKANKLKEKQQLAEILSGVQQRAQQKKQVPASEAGRRAMLLNADRTMGDIQKMLFPQGMDKPADRMLIAQAAFPFGGMPFTSGRTFNAIFEDMIQAKYRIETGAAGNKDEVDKLVLRFSPSMRDSDETIKAKLNQFDRYMKTAIRVQQGGRTDTRPDVATRFQQLIEEGETKQGAFNQLIDEGYEPAEAEGESE